MDSATGTDTDGGGTERVHVQAVGHAEVAKGMALLEGTPPARGDQGGGGGGGEGGEQPEVHAANFDLLCEHATTSFMFEAGCMFCILKTCLAINVIGRPFSLYATLLKFYWKASDVRPYYGNLFYRRCEDCGHELERFRQYIKGDDLYEAINGCRSLLCNNQFHHESLSELEQRFPHAFALIDTMNTTDTAQKKLRHKTRVLELPLLESPPSNHLVPSYTQERPGRREIGIFSKTSTGGRGDLLLRGGKNAVSSLLGFRCSLKDTAWQMKQINSNLRGSSISLMSLAFKGKFILEDITNNQTVDRSNEAQLLHVHGLSDDVVSHDGQLTGPQLLLQLEVTNDEIRSQLMHTKKMFLHPESLFQIDERVVRLYLVGPDNQQHPQLGMIKGVNHK